MKSFLKGLKILSIFAAWLIIPPIIIGYIFVKIGWPKSLIEYGYSYGDIGGTFLILVALIGLALLGIYNLGKYS